MAVCCAVQYHFIGERSQNHIMPKALLLSLEHRSRNPRSASLEELAEYRSRRRLWNMPHLGLLTVGALLAPKFDVDYVDLEYDPLPQTKYDLSLIHILSLFLWLRLQKPRVHSLRWKLLTND